VSHKPRSDFQGLQQYEYFAPVHVGLHMLPRSRLADVTGCMLSVVS